MYHVKMNTKCKIEFQSFINEIHLVSTNLIHTKEAFKISKENSVSKEYIFFTAQII